MKTYPIKIVLAYCLVGIHFLEAQYLDDIPFIPLPNEIVNTQSKLDVRKITILSTNVKSDRFHRAVNDFNTFWKKQTAQSLVMHNYSSPEAYAIDLRLDNDLSNKNVTYQLFVHQDGISIISGSEAGLFRGMTSLKQLLVFSNQKTNTFSLPTGKIMDSATYDYRGSMLDLARHFFDIEDIKKYIDILSFYKINFLHLHLSDDQGWRIEIKQWPNLTTIGGQYEVGGTPGGFLTQEQYKDLIAYAADRYITIVPEIDVPGHTNAALASYPELNCDGKRSSIYTGIEVGFSSLCAEKQVTYTFLKNVVDEISALTPGPYFHVGGDESYETSKDDFIQIIDAVFSYVEDNNKTPITWDNKVKTAQIVQYWTDESDLDVIGKSDQIIFSPASHAYLDMKYDSLSRYGLSWAGYSSVKNAYDWDPKTIAKSLTEKKILGIEAPVWTETVSTFEELSYLVFPRLLGHAEIGWTPKNRRNWKKYKVRLAQHIIFLETKGIQMPDDLKIDP